MKGSLLLVMVATVAVGSGCEPMDKPSPAGQFLSSAEFDSLGLPFSEAVQAGNMLYLSGQIGTLPGKLELVEGGVTAETGQTMENIRAVLERNGSGMDKVIKCTVFLADIDEWPAVNEVYRTFFTPPYPVRSAVAGSGLALGARVEVECIAMVD